MVSLKCSGMYNWELKEEVNKLIQKLQVQFSQQSSFDSLEVLYS